MSAVTSPIALPFSIVDVSNWSPGGARELAGELAMPEGFGDLVPRKGDRYRDAFTRICLYLAARCACRVEPTDTIVVVATEYGNLDAMLRLQQLARAGDAPISAQQFPHATTSSASVFVNIAQRITGGNATLNAGPLSSVVALLHGLLHVTARERGGSVVLAGDVYCEEAQDDVRKQASDSQSVTSGVACAHVVSGEDYVARFRFGAVHDVAVGLAANPDVHLFLDQGMVSAEPKFGRGAAVVSREWNRAHLLGRFLSEVSSAPAGTAMALGLSHGPRGAAVTVVRETCA